ncbi:helix-turn-helix transcriptional regulator [uncultured Dysosmobacter sp.]|uniref:helix-turn-helix transcriptional regulator n=1 Tax=uncultured Dysosmobacter sp. TaxID=2591384 RepID=UPI0026098DB5|nr:helix-turn-helix transcriptional regulator [uncultured Dysosmobacter sp.]
MLNWLVEIRGKRSQYEVAKEIGIAQSTYASIEVGSRNPSVQMAKRIATELGFEWTRFFEENSESA